MMSRMPLHARARSRGLVWLFAGIAAIIAAMVYGVMALVRAV